MVLPWTKCGSWLLCKLLAVLLPSTVLSLGRWTILIACLIFPNLALSECIGPIPLIPPTMRVVGGMKSRSGGYKVGEGFGEEKSLLSRKDVIMANKIMCGMGKVKTDQPFPLPIV